MSTQTAMPDLRTIEKAILLESAGCAFEHERVTLLPYAATQGVILHPNALAKKLLGIWGIGIGNDPRREASMPNIQYRDWKAEQADIERDPDPVAREQRLKEFRFDKERSDRIAAEFDGAKWDAVIDLEDVIRRRAMALSRMKPPLVEYACDEWLPPEVQMTEKTLGGDGSIPNENQIQITRDGYRFLGTGKQLRPKAQQRDGTHRFDEELEIAD